MRNSILVAAAVAIVVGGGSATAARLITGKDIRDGSITARDIRQGGISLNRLSNGTQRLLRSSSANSFSGSSQSAPAGPKGDKGDKGDTGPQGPKGDKGDPGAPGDTASADNWGVINRNTIGAPQQELRSGPGSPPNGTGSLNFTVQGNPDFSPQQKAAFGDETDFVGQSLSSITEIGFWVFTTGEDASRGNPNMPAINIEVDRNGPASGPPGFSTLVFSPPNSSPNRWSDYIDGTTVTPSSGPTGWYYTSNGTGTDTCNINHPCTFADAKAEFPDATIFTVAVTKGRDFSWQGAIDALRINARVFDFEEKGVKQSGA